MLKRIAIVGLVLVLVLAGGLYFWARSVFGHDTVRTALARQLTEAIGQPVSIGTIGASIYPRVTVSLGNVTIGEPARIQARTLDIGTDFRALLSRRIEHGSMRLDGARIELPLPAFEFSAGSEAESDGAPAVEIVSIDEIVLNDVEIVSGGRTLRGDVEAVPEGNGLVLRRLALGADDTTLDASGRFTSLAGPVGELTVKAGALNLDRLLAFATDFASGAGLEAAPEGPPPIPSAAAASPMNVVIALEADRATIGALGVEALSARVRLTDGDVSLEPLQFRLFGGAYDGALGVTLAGAPAFRWSAQLSGIDVAAATAFAGNGDVMTGRLSGRIDLTGRGTDAGSAIQSARGTARVQVVDGIIRNLGLVRTIVIATSMRADARPQGAAASDEPFKRLGATLAIADGAARSNDLVLESENLRLAAAGSLQLDGSAVDLDGKVQLSEALTKQAGRDLVRYAQEDGRVTLPVAISGPADNLKVRVDVADAAKRALRNKATEEAEKAIRKGLGDLFKRR